MSETLKVLTQAFIGESQARNRYTLYSNIAKKEGYIQISQIFAMTADQEREHASWEFRLIQDLKQDKNQIEVPASAPLVLGNTEENLASAIEGELYETNTMYPDFAKIAKEEGYEDIAKRLEAIAVAEKHHAERYQKLLKALENGTLFKKEEDVIWICAECGYIHIGKEAPKVCPSCNHPQGYFYISNEEY
ncbi:MAG: Rubrerythrin [candidate division WS6 bacterium 34_10]|uniref:Rubrerythrin n=1 Tax=candidate division WS6 bacterium 34_10 TaxID=1641389 RepID=A0A117M035_9BACT|nr:MAG: Rubrerythrin [candidate division WS6 bacterium 34_10]